MDKLKLHFEWQRPEGIRGPELRATWAWLEVWIKDKCLTRIFDHKAKTVRSELYIPLYPFAEWIACNWWQLLYEPEVHWLRKQRNYTFRHNMRTVGDGIVMPNVELRPQGRTIQAIWETSSHPYGMVDFISSGKALLDREQAFAELYAFVDSVIARLEQEGVSETLLQQTWGLIQETLADREEQVFCQAVALQGKDAYALTEEEANRVLEAARILPDSLFDDFLHLASWEEMLGQANNLMMKVDHLTGNTAELTSLRDLRRELDNPCDQALPWDQGYALARTVRSAMGTNGNVPSNLETFSSMLDIPVDTLNRVVRMEELFPGIEAMVGENERESPGFILKPCNKRENQIFALCRALCDYLYHPGSSCLISSGNTEGQKRNRAFAAEFLAPAELIQKYLHAAETTLEDIEEIAHELGVSSYVGYHQVQNHGLADIYSEMH